MTLQDFARRCLETPPGCITIYTSRGERAVLYHLMAFFPAEPRRVVLPEGTTIEQARSFADQLQEPVLCLALATDTAERQP